MEKRAGAKLARISAEVSESKKTGGGNRLGRPRDVPFSVRKKKKIGRGTQDPCGRVRGARQGSQEQGRNVPDDMQEKKEEEGPITRKAVEARKGEKKGKKRQG